MIEQRQFPRLPESVPAARRFVASSLPGTDKELADRVAVMVSEIATNAIQHGGTGFAVRVEVNAASIVVEVTDSGSGQPAMRTAQPSDRSGRGLRIVDVLADDWGVRAEGDEGKTIWFTVALQPEPTPS